MRNDTQGHGLTAPNTVGYVTLYMDGKEIRTRYFTNRGMRRDIIKQWTEDAKRLHKLKSKRTFEISIRLEL